MLDPTAMKITSPTRALAGVAAIFAGGMGLFALESWALGRWDLATLETGCKPMSPSTAVLFAVLALALGARLLWAGARAAEFAAMTGTALAALVGAVELARGAWGFPLPWDLQSAGGEASFGVMASGRMAPLSAVLFLLAAVAIAAQGEWLGRYRAARWVASLSASAGLLVGAVVALAHSTGTPFGYDEEGMPMALLTALTFVILHAGILLADKDGALPRAWRGTVAGPVGAGAPQGQGSTSLVMLALAAFVFLVGLGGFFYLRNEQASARHEAHDQLVSIAKLKAAQITAWRRERLNDAQVLAQFPGLPVLIAQIAENPAVENPERSRWAGYLADVRRAYAYDQIVVLDRELNPVMTEPAGMAWDKDMASDVRKEIAKAHDVIVLDLHRGGDGRIKLDLLAPIRAGGSRDFAGCVLIVIDAGATLFRQLQEWPTPSASGELVLLRREGDQVVLLDELRHADGTTFNRRFPLTEPTMLAAMALRDGRQGAMEGVDYRGVPVIGAACPVRDSPWTVIAKMDQAEAYAPVRAEAVQIFISLGLFAAVGALFGRTLWQQRQRALIQRQLAAERTARAVSERLAIVMQHAKDVIMLFDEEMRIVEANDRVLAVYGRTPEEMRRLTVRDLRTKETGDVIKRDFAQALTENGVTFEATHERKDGSTFPVEVSALPVEIEGRRHVLSIIRDITERKAAEAEILRLNRMYRLISEVNQVLVRARTRDELFAEICGVLVTTGEFPIAWIGLLNKETQLIEPVVVAGDEHGYVPGIRVSVDPALPEGRGPAGTAVREDRSRVCNDFFSDPGTEPWRERATGGGFRSMIALPLRCEGKIIGVIGIYASEPGFFQPRKVELMEETAGDISLALGVFAGEARQRAAEAALRQSEHEFRTLADSGRALIWTAGTDKKCDYFNRTWLAFTGRTFEQERGDGWAEGVHPDDLARCFRIYTASFDRRESFSMDYRMRRHDGVFRWVQDDDSPRFDDQGNFIGYIGHCLDITERKEAETELRKLSRIVEQAPISVVSTDLAGAIEYVNPAFLASSGYTAEEVIGRNPRVLKSGLTPPEIYAGMWQTITRGKVWHGELTNKKKTGEICMENVVVVPVLDEAGVVTHLVALKQDITANKAAEEALRESEKRFRELFDLESDAIMVVEAGTGRIIQANTAASAIYGYTVDELLTMTNEDLSAEPEKTRAVHAVVLDDNFGGIISIPLRYHRKRDGTVFPVDINMRAFRRGNQTLTVSAIRDITEQEKTRETLKRFNEELEAKVVLRTEEIAVRNLEMEALLQSIPDMVVKLHADGTLLKVQPAKGETPLAIATGEAGSVARGAPH